MRFKIDEHLPVEIKELLTHHQHDAVTVPDEGMAGAVDADVARACQKEARAFVTLDLDFSDIRAYPPEDYQGILVFRPVLQSITTHDEDFAREAVRGFERIKILQTCQAFCLLVAKASADEVSPRGPRHLLQQILL